MQLERRELGEPDERRAVAGDHVLDRLAAVATVAVCTQSGRCDGARFSKNVCFPTPFGQRTSVSARPLRCGTSTGAIAAAYSITWRLVVPSGNSGLSRFVSAISRPSTSAVAVRP